MPSLEFDPHTVKWGSCPDFNADPDVTWEDMMTKYPGITSMRVFRSTDAGPGTGLEKEALAEIPLNFFSNKPGNDATGLTSVKDTYDVPTITLPSGCDEVIYCPWHEIDMQVFANGIVLADWHDLMDNVLGQSLGTGVTTAVVMTAWGMTDAPNPDRPWANYYHDGIDYFCADFDGLDPDAGTDTYPSMDDWGQTLDRLDEIRTAHPGVKIGVPEFGAPCADGRLGLPSWDPTGSYRADWMLEWAERFRDFGMDFVMLFDFSNGMQLTYTATDIAAWQTTVTTPSAPNLLVFG